MAHHSLRDLFARARRAPGRLVLCELKIPRPDLSALKLFAEIADVGQGIIVYAVSPDFRGKNLAERNELVAEILDEALTDRELREISHLFTFTPSEFKPSVRKAVATR